jgi:polar amino acid transport system substrate-binding protein
MQMRPWLGVLVAGVLAATAVVVPAAYSEPHADVAPQGRLRVAFLLGPIYATKDRTTGELKGVAIDIGQALARRIGVSFEPVSYAALPDVLAAAKTGAWDIALMGINSERAAVLDFSAPYMEVEQGYLARGDVPVTSEADVDKGGIRVGVIEKAGADVLLSRTLKNAVLVRAANVPALFALLDAATVDVIAATKTSLFAGAEGRKGSRVLDGRILVEPIGIGVPKGRDAAAAYVEKFVQDAKAEGLVKSAIERAGLRGVVVAPN